MENSTNGECRLCGNNLEVVLPFGEIYPSTFLKPDEEPPPKEELVLARCPKDNLVQLTCSTDKEQLYRQYWYRSALNPTMVNALRDVYEETLPMVEIGKVDTVLDIGCNDGTLLNMFQNGIKVGVDPSRNITPSCHLFVNDFFPGDMPRLRAKVITAIAMFYDLDDPNTFLQAVTDNIHEDGIFVVQMTDLASMVYANAFDNVCSEHIAYYSLAVFKDLAYRNGLEVFHVSHNDVNGGSMRIFCANYGKRKVCDSVQEFLDWEKKGTDKLALKRFSLKAHSIAETVKEFLVNLQRDGCVVDVLGASTKGNTFLQFAGIDNNLVRAAAEVNEEKFGLRTVGANIPILSQEAILKDAPPDYFLVLPWHFREFFEEKLQGFMENGGRLIFPMPTPIVVTSEKRFKI